MIINSFFNFIEAVIYWLFLINFAFTVEILEILKGGVKKLFKFLKNDIFGGGHNDSIKIQENKVYI